VQIANTGFDGWKNKNMRQTIALLFFGMLASGPIGAKHWHEDDKHWKKYKDDEGHHGKGCYFEPRDARVVTEYYAPRRRELPPGLQKKLYRGGHLPPGWEKRMQPMPVVVERQLVPVPAGYSRGYIDGYAVIYSPRTQVVIDIMAVFGR
jgi:hypothetical protein